KSYDVKSRATDKAGLVQATLGSSTIIWDTTAPVATFSINANDVYATNAAVTLTLTAPAGVTQFRKADGNICASATWTTYAGGTLNKCLNTTTVANQVFNHTCPNYLTASGTAAWTLAVGDALFVNGQTYTINSLAVDAATKQQGTAAASQITWDSSPPSATFK